MSDKIGMARWFGWVDAMNAYLKDWHTRLLTYLFVCISLGVLGEANQKALAPTADMKPFGLEDVGKATTAEESDALKKLRRACTNTMHLAVVCLSDRSLWEMCSIIVYVCEPVRAWRTEQSTNLRSSSECCRWYQEQAAGKGFHALTALVARLADPDGLRHVGFGSPPAASEADLHALHPHVLNEDKLAESAGVLTMSLLSRRLASHMAYTRGLPGAFAGLLDPTARPRIPAWFQEVHAAWQRAGSPDSQVVEEVHCPLPLQTCRR
ncbi:unnamed protein product [Prorocentrum cordatum]|uniref:Uncharacterized protein n=1 Tax=Prorocentrum cordatum TaxID=2364126 RepID=A0ABN9RKQ9_9DINO|nr:unnamed protein product [Polarella glacialis]